MNNNVNANDNHINHYSNTISINHNHNHHTNNNHNTNDNNSNLKVPWFDKPDQDVIAEMDCRKGTNRVGANGVAANIMFFDRGTFGVLPFT